MSYGSWTKCTEKKCLTCKFWCGEREIERIAGNVKPRVRGQLGSHECLVANNKRTAPTAICGKWSKSPDLP